MNKCKRKIYTSLLLLLLLSVTGNVGAIESARELKKISSAPPPVAQPVTMSSIPTPVTNVGEVMAFSIDFTAQATYEIRAVDIKTSPDITVFPYKVDRSTYRHAFDPPAKDTVTYPVNLTVRGDAAQNHYLFTFLVTCADSTGSETIVELSMTTVVINRNESPSVPEDKDPSPVALPKVMVSYSSTNPAYVEAGEEFDLTLSIVNTSAGLAVVNMKITLSSEDGTFIPVSGSSSKFINRIGAKGTSTVTIRLKSKNSTEPNSYTVKVTFEYNVDIATYDAVTMSENISIPVTQLPRLQLSIPRLTPDLVVVGQDVNFMLSVNNIGKAAVHNVNVTIRDESSIFRAVDIYIGLIEQEKSGIVDTFLTPVAVGNTTLVITVTYEDIDGNVFTLTDQLLVTVDQRATGQTIIPPPVDGGKTLSPAVIIFVCVLVLVGLAALILLGKKRIAARRDKEDTQDADMMEFDISLGEKGESENK